MAERLGSTPHLSPLLRKLRRLGLRTPDDLLRLAVHRGCTHYAPPDFDASAAHDPGRERVSDLELAIALCSGAQAYDPLLVRCAAQLLGSVGISAVVLARLARMERCEAVVAQIAAAGASHDVGKETFWRDVLSQLRVVRAAPAGILPHWSRYVVETGLNGAGNRQPRSRWLRPTTGVR